jgi:ketosteroid isomerase-like protein
MIMRISAALAFGLLASGARAAPTDELMTAPRAFIAGLDAGKIDDAAATMTADATMIDEFPPHAWSGPDAFKRWLADFAASNTAAHITGGKVKLGDPIVEQATGDVAYVVAAASETYKQNGVRMAETARMVFALRREGGTWKIASWAWAGRKPHPAVKGS